MKVNAFQPHLYYQGDINDLNNAPFEPQGVAKRIHESEAPFVFGTGFYSLDKLVERDIILMENGARYKG